MKFNHLNVPNHWHSYWTRYPEGHTILEALIQWVSQVDEMVDNQNQLNDNIKDFRVEMDEFIERFDPRLQTEVIRTLKEWQADGFLDIIINDALQTQMDALEVRNQQQIDQTKLLIQAITNRVNALDNPVGGTYETLAQLKSEHPTGNTKRYVVTETGEWYYWNDTDWVSGGSFQSSGGVANYSVYPSKTNFNFEFFPITSAFYKRTISIPTGEYIPSTSRYTSDTLVFDITHTVVSIDPAYDVAVRLFDANNTNIYTSLFRQSIPLKDFEIDYPTATHYIIYVASTADNTTIADNIGDYLSSVVFVETPTRAVPYKDFETATLTNWIKTFPTMNFREEKLTSDDNGYLRLGEDISTTNFHNNLLYYDSDIQQEIKTVKATFITDDKVVSSNRIFIESSDGRVVWFGFSVDGGVDAYSLDKHTGVFSIISKQYTSAVPTYPTQPSVDIDFKVMLVGFVALVYIDNKLICSYDISPYMGDKINRTGISFRGNVRNNSILKSFNVDYKNEPFVHISVDDVFNILKDLTENQANYDRLFDHPDFNFLKEMHEEYGAVFSLYVYNRVHDDTFTLSDMTTKYKFDFANNATWLKFGYHSDWDDTRAVDLEDDYLVSNVESVYADIARFASYRSIDKLPRLGFFSAKKSALMALRDKGLILGTLTADDDRASNVGLNGVALSVIRVADYLEEDGLSYFRTEKRLDGLGRDTVITNLNTLSNSLFNQNTYILFAHTINQSAFRGAIEWANKRGIKFDYPLNNI